MNRLAPRNIVKLFFIFAALSIYIASTSTPNQHVAAATNGRIAYASPDDSSDLQIHSVNIDGSDDKQLTNDPYMHFFPRYSPDGSQLVFAAAPPPSGNLRIVTMNTDGSNHVTITNDDGFFNYMPAWSPDGSKIAFSRAPDDFSSSFALYTIHPDGTNLTAITDGTASSTSPSWNNDSSKLTYVCDDGQICTVNSDGTNNTQVTNDVSNHTSPSFSPDGTQIAYIEIATGYVQTIKVMNTDGSNPHTISTGGTMNDDVSWSPDGTKLLYDRLDASQSIQRIYYINLDGTGETVVSPDNQVGYIPAWQPIPATDTDGDGVASAIEAAGPNSGDGNGDGTADKNQANVTSFLSPITSTYVSLQSTCATNGAVSAMAVPALYKDAAFSYPAGLLNFSLNCSTPGATATVTQYFHGLQSSPTMVLRKYNNTTHAYATVVGAMIGAVPLGGTMAVKASYPITDGSSLDQDGAINGVIIDPVGLASPSVGAPNTGFGGNSLLSWLSAAPSL